jgi:cytochrome c553
MTGRGTDPRTIRSSAHDRCARALVTLALACLCAQGRADPASDAARGRLLAEGGRCPECHGAQGEGGTGSDASASAPRLAGQRFDYLLKEFRDFRDGRRHSDAMDIIARDDDDEVLDILRYYAGAARRAAADPPPAAQGVRRLFEEGDAGRAIRACADCHGAGAEGSAGRRSPVPRLAGQVPAYLERQLRDWRGGARRNSAEDVMNREAAQLTDAEIDDLARYLSNL